MNAEKAITPTSTSVIAVRARKIGRVSPPPSLKCGPRSCPGAGERERLVGAPALGEAGCIDIPPAEEAALDHAGDGRERGARGLRDVLEPADLQRCQRRAH